MYSSESVYCTVLATYFRVTVIILCASIIILILHLSVCESVCDVRAGGHGKPFDPS